MVLNMKMEEWKSRINQELKEMSEGENIVKWINGKRISWLGHLEREWRRVGCPKKYYLKNWRRRMKRKAEERIERRSRKRSSSAGSE
jgi:hypothetical protein